MYLEDEHIYLRAIEPEDLDKLHQWENDTSLWIHGNTLAPYSKLAIRQYITDALSGDIYQNRQLRLMVVLKDTEEVVGTVDFYDFEPRHARCGIGILIDKAHRGKKYASKTLMLTQQYAFDFLHLQQLYAHIAANNTTSIGLFENAGYEVSGRLKDWLKSENSFEDVFVLQLRSATFLLSN